jgi:tRNA A37 threonylcarbamoyltransferase TsaD
VEYPKFPGLAGDNAAMIGIAAAYYAEAGRFIEDPSELERNARMAL